MTDKGSTLTEKSPVIGWTVFGHPGAKRLLSRSYELNRLSHAYLITGPDKVGKRTLALDIAAMVNGERIPDMFGELPPLDLKSSHQGERIRKGIHSDVRLINPQTEIDGSSSKVTLGASNLRGRQTISIDHIRDMIKDSVTMPFEGTKKVFIIDGAHRMVEAASNAMLKILEEPSGEVIIILTAPTLESLPETIVSRCQRIELRSVETTLIEHELIHGYGAEEAEGKLLSRLAQGCPGWAIDALNDPTIVDAHNQAVLRFAELIAGGIEERFRYARQTSQQFWRDRDAVITEINRWIEWWRDVAMIHHKLTNQLINVEWTALLSEIAAQLNGSQISNALTSLQDALSALERNAVPQITLEVLMLDLPSVDPAKVPSTIFEVDP